MVTQSAIQSSTPLRVITQRISSTPSQQLPHIAPFLAASISNCANVLSSEKGVQTVDGAESSVLVHKLKTQLSALLQDKSPHARYSAVILIKATVEAGGWKFLQSAGPWVRGLISILGRPDPTSTKKLCIVTLTRIFLLTQEHQSLIREITTPSLAGFITICLNMVKPSNSSLVSKTLLLDVLQASSELIVFHPTLFRPFVPQFQTVIHPLIAPTPSDPGAADTFKSSSRQVAETARHLFVLLHVCGAKVTAREEWAKSLQSVLTSTQRTADSIFRALVEDWRPVEKNDISQSQSYGEVVSDQRPAPLPLPEWTGIYAGLERLDGFLHIVQAFIACTTSVPITLPLSNIMNLVDRVLSALRPSSTQSSRIRPETSRNEREGLFAGLPQLHFSAMRILSLMISRLGHDFAATSHIAIDQVFWVMENEHHDSKVRKAAYEVVSQVLNTFGHSLPRSHLTSLSQCVKLACADLLPSDEASEQGREASSPASKKSVNGNASGNADSYLKTAETRCKVPSGPIDTIEAAQKLLPLTLTSLPPGFLSYATRCQIDRTAILTNNKEIMLASVMNPPASIKSMTGQKAASSIMPFLARAFSEASEVQALLRPQMPMVQAKRDNGEEAASVEDEDFHIPSFDNKGTLDVMHGEAFGFNAGRIVENAPADLQNSKEELSTGSRRNEQVAQASGPQTPFAVSYVSSKRDREENPSLENHTSNSNTATSGSVESSGVDSPSKRARLLNYSATTVERPESTPQTPTLTQISGQASTVPISTAITGGFGTRYDEEQGESDESDFVMPTLNMDPDTDEEDDDGDDV